MKASDEAKPQRRGSDVHREEVIVVGAGQAGLSMGYWLRKLQRSFLLLEAGPRIGESWRQRYDSLVLFTPRRYSALPGLALPGDPEGRPTPGLFFLGFPWQPSRGSALVGWVGKDARRLAARLANQRTGTRLRRRDHEPRTTGRRDHRLPSPLLIGNRLFFRDASPQRGERKAPVTRSAFVSRSEPFD